MLNLTSELSITMSVNCSIDESNCTEEPYLPYSDRPETYILPFVFLFILIVGVTGNGVLVLTILRHANMRNVPNTYVLSLALGDLLVILTCVPFTITVYVIDSWPFGLILCKISECAKDISVGVSVFTLTALSADRFFAIVDPMRKLHATGGGKRATRFTSSIATLIWCLAVICATPATFSYIRVFRVNKDVTFQTCYPFPEEFGPNYPKTVLLCRFFVYYAIPLSIIAVFYCLMARHLVQSTRNIPGEMQGQVKQIKARKKVAKMVMAFVVIFAICFFPQHVFMLWFYIHPTAERDYNSFWHLFRIVGFCLAFANSCINPIALYLVSGSFRKYFKRYLFCCCGKRRGERNSIIGSRRRDLSLSITMSRRQTSSRRCHQSIIQMSTWQSPAVHIRDRSQNEQETTTTACNNGYEQRI
ncbi:neuropeptide CCHamide-1 receptor-like [Leptopilina heterotoma]|uniref:neuropeptide CCHamide-1 receptor-like n=1 Tax=Leptopilina heterotoma TaxID=63436 RepID=UPI001CAA181B|nr:neuropeptide CCHamide-1 receptor-like [Leptopilina heterotoma]XP_043482683.1 neuropeptide CCHamide-1 receptor-like [Leptopilina heterotoma]XP_043482684.1 neuropeptide CCHamide-1 receptor-like [Leptopilina heterotoma]XP_043482685.1 neuropeptide CCHamide-1 receptor-like [Leptopilina heterotoma]XP_043482686.1 neuropeptide CCHamide-1 receptor-like [Leptopilina heterotoma]XP_043482687.1 neuropeptide CCHamide-1 receptor-like [Leptopilina heterotoma]XP_043482688.1 neuropeptide CCHamide-1 receptor